MHRFFVILSFLLASIIAIICFVEPGFHVLHKTEDMHPGSVDNSDVIVYLINMDRSKTRLDHMKPYVEGLAFPFERIVGVEGNKITKDEISRVFDIKHYQEYAINRVSESKGVIGCSLSHLKVWKTFLSSRYKYALVLEDDITFDPVLLSKAIQEMIDKHSDKWDVATFLKNSTDDTISIAKLSGGENINLDFKSISGANAYLLNRKAAAEYVNYFFPIIMPVDIYYSRPWEFGIKFVSVEPFIVHHAPSMGSESGSSVRIMFESEPENRFAGTILRQKTKIARIFYNAKLFVASLFS